MFVRTQGVASMWVNPTNVSASQATQAATVKRWWMSANQILVAMVQHAKTIRAHMSVL